MENNVKQDICTVLEYRVKDACAAGLEKFSEKIGSVLEWIAVNESLRQFVTDCLTDFDFKAEFNKSVRSMRYGICMPIDKKKTVAYAFGLFYELDADKNLLPYVLMKWYFDNDEQSAFELFVKDVVLPFLSVVDELYLSRSGATLSKQKDKNTSLAIAYLDEIIAKMSKDENVLRHCYFFREKLLNGNDVEKIVAFNGLKQVLGKTCQAKMAQIEKCIVKEE